MLNDSKYIIDRVIARPFVGKPGSFKRTSNRRDYALKPFGITVMNELKDNDFDVLAIGKIHDIFNGEGVAKSVLQLTIWNEGNRITIRKMLSDIGKTIAENFNVKAPRYGESFLDEIKN